MKPKLPPIESKKPTVRFEAMMKALDAKPGSWYDWVIETKAGSLEISLHSSLGPGFKGMWLACKFEDIPKACQILGIDPNDHSTRLNTWSGKWNWISSEFLKVIKKRNTVAEEKEATLLMLDAFFKKIKEMKGQ